ncbi:MAG: hypothetical protein WDA00_04485, partial [Eubacteriales bacterium]
RRVCFFLLLVLSLGLTACAALSTTPATTPVAGGEALLSGNGGVGALFAAGSGTQADPYTIATAAQLQAFAASVNAGNDYAGRFVRLSANIDLGGTAWQSIGNLYAGSHHARVFAGHFDGGGHVVSNFTAAPPPEGSYTAFPCVGLFGYVSGTVRQVDVSGANLSVSAEGRVYGGVLVGYLTGTVEHCVTDGTLSVSSDRLGAWAGGVVGYTEGQVRSCVSTAAVTATLHTAQQEAFAGGIAGQNKGTLSHCLAYADLSVSAPTVQLARGGGVTGCNDGTYDAVYYCEAGYFAGVGEAATLSELKSLSFYTDTLGFGSAWSLSVTRFPRLAAGQGTGKTIPAACASGSIGNPIAVGTASAMRTLNPARSYTLTASLSLGSWTPIPVYYGSFDGGGYTLSGMTHSATDPYSGLFGCNYGSIRNLMLSGVSFTNNTGGGTYVGALAGCNFGTVRQVQVLSGTLNSKSLYPVRVGGLLGVNRGGLVSESAAAVNLSGVGTVLTAAVGGLVGENTGMVERSYAAGNTVSQNTLQYAVAAGLVGVNAGTVQNCYATGNATATAFGETAYAAGLVGQNLRGGEVLACYATGIVTVTARNGAALGGGLVAASEFGSVSGSFATGNVRGTTDVPENCHIGGLVGGRPGQAGQLTDNLRLTDQTLLANDGEATDLTGVITATESQLRSEAFLTEHTAFSSDRWTFSASHYPTLR